MPLVPVSAKTRIGLDELIEMILLVADLQELKANPKRDAIGTIVEAKLDKGRGPVATALVQTGTLKVGDIIVVGETFGRVRALENEQGKRVTKAGPSTAVVILGLSDVPMAGDILRVVGDEKEARTMVETRKAASAAKGGDGSGRATLEDLYSQIQAGQAKELRIILKADVSGSLGAITHALEQLDQDEIRLNVLLEGAGDITDNDIMLAAASNAIVVGFNTKITDTARRAAEAEGVDVRLYDIIYKLTDDVGAALKGLLEPEIVEVVEGRAEVRQVIRVGKNTVIAGSFVTDGRIVRGGNARVWRSSKVIATDRIESLRRFRDDVREVQQNYECGIGLANFHDIVEGDVIECFTSQIGESSLGQLSSAMSQRTERVDELLRQEIGSIVSRDVADPRVGFVTITEVETTTDLRHAKVWVSVIGQPAERDGGRRGAPPRHAVHPPRARQAAPDQADPGPARPSRRHRRAWHAHPPAAGRDRDGRGPAGRRARRRVAADADRPGPPGGRPRRGAAIRGPTGRSAASAQTPDRAAADDADQNATPDVPMSVDLAPYLDAVPAGRRGSPDRGPAACSRSATRTRMRTRSAPRSAWSGLWRRSAVAPTPCAPIPSRRSTTSSTAWTASGPTRTRPPTMTCWSSRTAVRSSGSARSAPGTPSCSNGCRGSSSTTTRPTTPPARRTGSTRQAAATCEMVALLAARLGIGLDLGDGAMAAALMAGIVMDTATFAHPNATPRTLVVSAALVEAGAPLSDISRRLYRTKPDAQLRLFGVVLDRLETADDGRIVWSSITDADLVATGADRAHSEGIIDLLSQAEAAEVAIVFKQSGKATRVSVRTKPGGVDATVLTGRFGGGGHARAAGASIEAPLEDARPPVLAEATRLVAALGR